MKYVAAGLFLCPGVTYRWKLRIRKMFFNFIVCVLACLLYGGVQVFTRSDNKVKNK